LNGSFFLLELSFKHLNSLFHLFQFFQKRLVRITLRRPGAATAYERYSGCRE